MAVGSDAGFYVSFCSQLYEAMAAVLVTLTTPGGLMLVGNKIRGWLKVCRGKRRWGSARR